MDRAAAVDRVEAIVETVATEPMAVPVHEVWVYGDLALGLDPIDRLDVYVTKDLLLSDDDRKRGAALDRELGVEGIGRTIRAGWAAEHPEYVRANDGGHVAPERCLAAHLLPADEPVHLEVCNSSFEDNVTRRLDGALATGAYERILDPRGVALWIDGLRDDEAFEKLRGGEFVFPTLPKALEMLGAEADEAERATEVLAERRREQSGTSVRGNVV